MLSPIQIIVHKLVELSLDSLAPAFAPLSTLEQPINQPAVTYSLQPYHEISGVFLSLPGSLLFKGFFLAHSAPFVLCQADNLSI
jgi:hypothetical protein